MRQIWAYAWKEIYVTFRDRNLLLIMLVTPLALAVIIGFAFGGTGSASSFEDIGVALVNLDEGATLNGQPLNYGTTLRDILTGASATSGTTNTVTCGDSTSDDNQTVSLDKLLNVTVFTTAAEAHASVQQGDNLVSVVIAADFTRNLSAVTGDTSASFSPSTITIVGSGASPIVVNIVKSIVESISNSLVTGNIAIATTINTLIDRATTNAAFGLAFAGANATGAFQPDFTCAFTSAYDTVSIQPQALTLAQEKSVFVQILISIGAGQAVYFAMFTAQAAFQALFEERKQGTLQRLIVAPIPRLYIMAGKVVGTFLTILLQLSLLLIALTVIASLIEGQAQFIWGNSPLHLLAITLVMSLSVCGVGVLITGVAKTPQQAQLFSPIIITLFGVLGGIFGFSIPEPIPYVSPIYWGVNALSKLSNGDTAIGLNLVVLLVLGGALFAIGVFFFNKRVDV